MESFEYYIFVLVALIIGFVVVKKVATCLLKTVVCVVVLAILGIAYFFFT